MFNLSDLSKALYSNKKSSTFSFKDTSSDSLAPNSLHVLPRKG